MSDPTFGISITRVDNEPRPPVWSDMSVVGIIGTAPDASAGPTLILEVQIRSATKTDLRITTPTLKF